MQNKFKGFRNFVKGKGYYIALLLCTVVVGVTGYYLLTEKETGTLPLSESTFPVLNPPQKPPHRQLSHLPPGIGTRL